MSGPSPEAYNAKILSTLEQIQRDVAEIKKSLGAAPSTNGSSRGGEVADERDLDGEHGDPLVKYDPKSKYWSGRSFAGYRFSETTPEYLDAQAKYLDACAYMGAKDPDEKKRKSASYKARDAARARGWAARLRNGWQPQATKGAAAGESYDPNTGEVFDQHDVPFVFLETRLGRV